jgi:mannitol/fructose-specific phosphotransferase system IIA component
MKKEIHNPHTCHADATDSVFHFGLRSRTFDERITATSFICGISKRSTVSASNMRDLTNALERTTRDDDDAAAS